jgi:hypothetical protein
MRGSWIGAIVLGAVAVTALTAQIVPQQKVPPLFKGEKKPKDEDGKTRSLSGTVKDAQENGVDGAVVQLKDTKSLQVRSFITKNDGVYHFHGLSTDIDYQVKADYKGQASDVKTLSVFNSSKNAVIHLKLEPKK